MAHNLNAGCALLLGAGLTVMAGCMQTGPRMPPPPPPRPDTTVYFYPAHGQTADQQNRDKFECNTWAVRQSGFDPAAPGTPPHLRMQVAAGPPSGPSGMGIAAGALGGAAVGAFIAPPWHAGAGALFGALAGGMLGGAAEQSQRQRAQDEAEASAFNQHVAALEGQALNFRRAMSACLEARGYQVR